MIVMLYISFFTFSKGRLLTICNHAWNRVLKQHFESFLQKPFAFLSAARLFNSTTRIYFLFWKTQND